MQTKKSSVKKLKIHYYLFPLFILVLVASCKKNKGGDEEIETTFKLSGDQAVSEGLADDANIVFFEAAAAGGLIGARTSLPFQSTNTLSCASVDITPGSFPKTITIDFGAGCTSLDGINRKGKVIIVLSDSVHKTGATAVMNFENYFVETFQVEGTITWVNTTSGAGFSWTRTIENGKITAPGGNYFWLHEGVKQVAQTSGSGTPLNLLDDVFSITGNHTVTNPAGKSRTATIIDALEKKTICHNITKGKVKIEGPAHFAILDYGDGTCDRVATISVDGFPPRTILLP